MELIPTTGCRQREYGQVLASLMMDGRRAQIHYVTEGDAAMAEAQQFVRDRFREAYAARVEYFMPSFVTLRDENGCLLAVAGLQSALAGPLFLERYLDLPLPRLAGAAFRRPVARAGMIEVGNLASMSSGSGRLVILALTDILHRFGYDCVAFTGTRKLLNTFNRFGIELHALAEADGDRLGAAKADWGSYYETGPVVMVGDIGRGLAHLQASRLLDACGYHYLGDPALDLRAGMLA